MEDVVRKIKKALALSSNNPNEEEAQSAMLLAQRLMAKHSLSMSDVSIGEENKKKTDKGYIRLKRIMWWQRQLAAIMAENFRCYSFFSSGSHMAFLGIDSDVKIAKDLFEYGCKSIKYLSSQYLSSRQEQRTRKYANALKNDYISGFLSGLNDKFKEQVAEKSLALVLVKDEIVVQAFEEMDLKQGRPWRRTTASDEDALKRGLLMAENSKSRKQLYMMGKHYDESIQRNRHGGNSAKRQHGGKLDRAMQ